MVFGLFEVISHSALSVMDVEPVCVCVDFHLHIIFDDSSSICKSKKIGINRLKLVYFAAGIKMFIKICLFFYFIINVYSLEAQELLRTILYETYV